MGKKLGQDDDSFPVSRMYPKYYYGYTQEQLEIMHQTYLELEEENKKKRYEE